MNTKELLERASSEIKQLRAQNREMASRLDVFDKMMLLFTSAPAYPGYGMMHPDIVYELDKAIELEESKSKQSITRNTESA